MHPKSTKLPKNTPKIKETTQPNGWGEKESGSEGEIGEKECGTAQEKEKMRFREVHIDTNP